MIYVRADGNTNIGMGHIMRCLSISDAISDIADASKKPVFILAKNADKEDIDCCLKIINDRGYEATIIDNDYRRMEKEIPLLANILSKDKTDVVLVDSYQVTVSYYEQLRRMAKVVCLEDMGYSYPVDLLINYNIYATDIADKYLGNEIEHKPDRVMLGVKYQPLRKEFSNVQCNTLIKDIVSDVMITTGGSDPNYATGAMLEKLTKEAAFKNIRFHVVSGPFNTNADRMKKEYKEQQNVIIYTGLSDLSELIKKCDVVITATGSTIYEVSALGIPFISFYYAENQRQGAEAFARLINVVNAGCFNLDNDAYQNMQVVDNIVNALKKCICDKEYRELLSNEERQLVDGKGAVRIAQAILELEERR